MNIEVLGFAECPNTFEFLERVKTAARRFERAKVVYIDQEALPISDLRRGYPTPGAWAICLVCPARIAQQGCRVYKGL
ncbi:MAG: hypothetical protein IPM33_00185 [Phycisphaerales bacterium]|nr:hypothetical protein [Phycisphaerales bacterium]